MFSVPSSPENSAHASHLQLYLPNAVLFLCIASPDYRHRIEKVCILICSSTLEAGQFLVWFVLDTDDEATHSSHNTAVKPTITP